MELYTFGILKQLVEKKFNVSVESGTGDYIKPLRIELTRDDISRVQIDFEGIYVEDDKGNLVRGFLHKNEIYRRPYMDYVLERPSCIPKFHIVNCEVLQKMKEGGRFDGVYIFSNVPVRMSECSEIGGAESDLRLCTNCMKAQDEINDHIYTDEFVEEYLDTVQQSSSYLPDELPIIFEKDSWGYVHGWNALSTRYREAKGYKCEKCSLDLSAYKYYLEVHHKNGNKTDNKERNLICLCTGCHSEVDENHRINYSGGVNKQKLEQFRNMFPMGG